MSYERLLHFSFDAIPETTKFWFTFPFIHMDTTFCRFVFVYNFQVSHLKVFRFFFYSLSKNRFSISTQYFGRITFSPLWSIFVYRAIATTHSPGTKKKRKEKKVSPKPGTAKNSLETTVYFSRSSVAEGTTTDANSNWNKQPNKVKLNKENKYQKHSKRNIFHKWMKVKH